jgi:hypothetical protein
MHFGSRACKIEQWILEEFNFEHLLFFRWHLSCLPSSFNRHTQLDSSGGPASASIRLRTSPTTLSQEPIFQDSVGPSKNGYHFKFVDCLDDIRLKHLYVLCIQLVEVYVSKEVINLHECIPYPLWQ